MNLSQLKKIRQTVSRTVDSVKITDIHTHIYPSVFGKLLLWGIDELVTYHYLMAETMRWVNMPYEKYWAMPKKDQADLIWKTLFTDNSPYSEACRGVLTVIEKLGLDVKKRDLNKYRKYFSSLKVEQYTDIVFKTSGVKEVVMTNDPFDDLEKPVWDSNVKMDERFHAALRLDGLLNDWPNAYKRLNSLGYKVSEDLNQSTVDEVKRFLNYWVKRMKALYMAVSLPPDFAFPEQSNRGKLIKECILPVCEELNLPFAMMIGVKKLTNPELKVAGDSVGKGNINVVEYFCRYYPNNKFLVTMLSRENQHELCIVARKFRNLMVFGCWWYLNNPSIIEMMTRQRMELLGQSFIPQHSDARVLDQLIYKWGHSRKIISDVLFDKYADIAKMGWVPTKTEIERDVEKLFTGNFWNFIKR